MTKRTGSTVHSVAGSDATAAVERIGALAKTLGRAAARFLAGGTTLPEAARTLQDIKTELSELATCTPALDSLLVNLTHRVDAAFNELDADLRDALKARGWSCDGKWPTLYVERALQVHIDTKNRSALVGGVRVRAASVEGIVQALIPLVAILIPADFAADRFVNDLSLAYDDASRGSTLVPIYDVYRTFVVRAQKPKFWRDAIGAGFVGISADQFRARLSAAIDSGAVAAADGRQLRLLPPLDPKEGLFMYQPAERRFAFVGRIEFVRAD